VPLELGEGIAGETDSLTVAEAILGDEEAAELDIN